MNNDIRNLSKWLNEEQEAPIDRQALARVLAMAEQPAQQEPIWFWTHPTYGRLYKQPPAQRTWVGLTDEEIRQDASWFFPSEWWAVCKDFARTIENELKEKNSD